MPESTYISALVQGDINVFRNHVCRLIDDFYKNYDVTTSIDKTYITAIISCVHEALDWLNNELDQIGEKKDV